MAILMLPALYICVSVTQILGSIVETEYGQVSGHLVNVDNGRGHVTPVEVFHAVPFAADTSGANRFASPKPREPWDGVYDASPLGPACIQSTRGVIEFTHPGWDYWSEDCLHADIYSKNVTGGPYAVMLWLYGGAFTTGANFQYPGHFFATRDVVVVSANYRLNDFGFAYSGNEACPGNAGLWDQNAAIQWVINNIANFGGDPERITICGQSAGGDSAAFHVLSPASKDLFQQAIMQSGAETMPGTIQLEPENNVEGFAASLGCLGANDAESIECMRQLTWQDVKENGSCNGCWPVVDGPGGFLPEGPRVLREKGDIMTGPIMAGITHDECSTYLVGIVPEVLFGCCNRSYYERVLRNRFVGLILPNADNETKEDTYQALDFNYSPWPHIYDNYQNRESLERILTDGKFGYGWDNLVKAHSEVAPTWAYIYNFRGRNSSQLFPEWMGVPHIGEIPYVWGFPLLPFNQEVLDDSEIEFDYIHWTVEDIRHADFAMDLWANFAKYGNPTPQPVDNPLGGTTVWPQFTWDEMNVLEIKNTSIEAVEGWIQQDYAFFTDYIPYLVSDYINPAVFGDVPDDMVDWVKVDVMSWLINNRRNGEPAEWEEWDEF